MGDVLDRVASLGGRVSIGPSFEQMLEAAGTNRTGPVIEANGTADMTKSKLTTATAASSAAWPSVQTAQSALAGTTLGGYASGASSTLGALGLTGTQMPASDAWTAGLPEAAGPWVGAITDAAQRND